MILVIGATGFIGQYVVEHLIENNLKVVATGRNKIAKKKLQKLGVQFIDFDLTNEKDIEKLPKEGVTGVVFLSALLPANSNVDITTDENAADYFKINTIGLINVLEYCRKNNIKKIITTSSYADVFNSWKKGYAIKETELRGYKYCGDHAVYVFSKNAAGDCIEYYNQQHGFQGIIFRLPPVYGVGPHSSIYVNGKYYKSGVQTFVEKAKAGQDIEIWGDPHLTRDIIYVKDVARAIFLALKSEKAIGLYNMTSGIELELCEQVKTIIDIFKVAKESKIIYKPEKNNTTPSFLFDMSKAKKDFGFIPKYSNYRDMMLDYKTELESSRWEEFIVSREKGK